MPEKPTTNASLPGARRLGNGRDVVSPSRLWFGVLGGALAWFMHHSLGYGLVEINCHSNRLAFEILGVDAAVFLGLLLTAIAVAVTIAAGLASLVSPRSGRLTDETEVAGAPERRVRSDFMAQLGVLFSILFLVAILAGTSAFLFLRPC